MTNFFGPFKPKNPFDEYIDNAVDKVKEWWDSGDDEEESPSEGVSDPPTEDAKPDLKSEQQIFIDQYFLTENIEFLSAKNRVFRPTGYQNFTCLDELDTDIQNEIVSRADLGPLLELTPAQMAYLVPKIRIFKTYCGADGKRSMIEFPFKANYDENSIRAMLSNQGTGGSSVGIKDLRVDFRTGGKTEAGLGRQLGVDLSIYAQTAGDLFYSETIDGQRISISDLANRAGDRQVRIVIGWANPKKYPPGLFSDDIKEAIRRSRIALDCHIINHTLNFERTGEVTLSVQMNGALEEIMGFESAMVFSEPSVDIVELEEEKKGVRAEAAVIGADDKFAELVSKTAEAIRQTRGDQDAEAAERKIQIEIEKKKKEELKRAEVLEDEIKRRRQEDLQSKYSSIVDRLQGGGHMYYIDVPLESIKDLSNESNYNVSGYKFDGPRLSAIGTIASLPGSAPGYTEKSPENHRINFFYFGGLLEVIYDLAKDNEARGVTNKEIRRRYREEREKRGTQSEPSLDESRKCFRGESVLDTLLPIVGTMVVPDQSDAGGQSHMINMADIPIAQRSYDEWFRNEVKGRKLSNISLNNFVTTFINKLVKPSLQQTEQIKKLKGIYEPQINSFISSADANGEPRLKKGGRGKLSDIKRTQFVDPETPDALFRKRFIHQIISIPDPTKANYSDILNISEEEAAGRGVYTLKLGRDRGLIKNIGFNRNENARLEAARITDREGEDLLRLVPDIYDAKVDMFGNMNFLPGQYVIIDPMLPMMGTITDINSPARQIGLGGFYFVLNTQLTVSETGFETILDCRQQFSLDARALDEPLAPKPVVKEQEKVPESRTIPSIANLFPAEANAHLNALNKQLESIDGDMTAENELEYTEAEAEMLASVESEDEMIFFEDEVADINNN